MHQAISSDSSAYTMHPLLLYNIIEYMWCMIRLIMQLNQDMYSGSEGHNTKYKLYVRSNEAKGNEYALSLLS